MMIAVLTGRSLAAAEAQQQHAAAHQGDAEPLAKAGTLAQERGGEDGDEHDTELVDRRHLRGVAQLERAEVADPGRAGGQRRQHEEERGLRRDLERALPLARRIDQRAQGERDDDGAQQRGEIGLDRLDAHLGEDRGQGGEEPTAAPTATSRTVSYELPSWRRDLDEDYGRKSSRRSRSHTSGGTRWRGV